MKGNRKNAGALVYRKASLALRVNSISKLILLVMAQLMLMGVFVVRTRTTTAPSSLGDDTARGLSNRRQDGGFSQWETFSGREYLLQQVLEAKAFLVDLHIPEGALEKDEGSEDSSSYEGVKGVFCFVDWKLQKEQPSTVAMFRDLVRKSGACPAKDQQALLIDIAWMVEQARDYDESHPIHSLEIGGGVFHEARCGSTLVSNLLAASHPQEHRMYSEPLAPIQTMLACTDKSCSRKKVKNLLQDVLYLMGRSNDSREKRVFYKISSRGARYMHTFTSLLPSVPWFFVYRDPVEVLMSHDKDGSDHSMKVCTRNQHPLINRIVDKKGLSMENLSTEQFCAAHTATLCEAALMEHEKYIPGHFIRYDSLPQIMWETIVPKVLGLPLDKNQIEHMQEVSGMYSKGGRGIKHERTWKDDTETKQANAPETIQNAARLFLSDSYDRMNAHAKEL